MLSESEWQALRAEWVALDKACEGRTYSITDGGNALERLAFFVGRHGVALRDHIDALTAERDKLQAFKAWVHQYLDAHGVPHHPPGTHGAEGCRIGDRMDWLMDRLEATAEERDSIRAELDGTTALNREAAAQLERERESWAHTDREQRRLEAELTAAERRRADAAEAERDALTARVRELERPMSTPQWRDISPAESKHG
jgi:hypothetical protein